ncbi:hypothetical protein KY290_024622 [Solanum tuberosum]|uniref:Uncharacterized protein n=1 Tax=Solanum tuberosum TaxID=4113 RepID=A0ABQ7UR88_SOLTU|nr:hypothetical protein KY284_023468 [Solanum tuberosum]KAH0754352.1 hypothetical protein KY290_024622 [Solanum tuberosum]
MNIPDDEIEHDVEEDQTPTPIVDIGGSSQLKQLNNLQDDEIGFYIGMTFKNKEELVISLHIACLKRDFRLAKVINSRSVYYFKCAHPVPPENSWIVPLKILEREIPPPYVDPSKSGRRQTKSRRGVEESFPTRKNKCSICKNIGHKRTTCPVQNAP